MRPGPLVVCGAALLAACGDSGPARQLTPLMNGQVGAHEAIGELGGCTATVIRPHAVLAAAHCLVHPGQELRPPPYVFTLDGEMHLANAVSIPEEYHLANAGKDVAVIDRLDGDILVVHFEDSVKEVTLPLASHPPAPGDALELWGSGRTGPSSYGSDLGVGEATVKWVDEMNIVAYGPLHETEPEPQSAALCPGDSGGPSFATEGERALVGIHSTNGPYLSSDCGKESWDIRVDRYRDWILKEIASYNGEAPLEPDPEPEEPPECEPEDGWCDSKWDRTGAAGDPGASGCGVTGRPPAPTALISLILAVLFFLRRRGA